MDNAHSGLRSAAVFALCGLFAVLAVGLAALSGASTGPRPWIPTKTMSAAPP